MGRTSKRPIQGDGVSAAADSVVCAASVGGELADDEGRVESTMTRHSMPSDNSIYQTQPSAQGVCTRRKRTSQASSTLVSAFTVTTFVSMISTLIINHKHVPFCQQKGNITSSQNTPPTRNNLFPLHFRNPLPKQRIHRPYIPTISDGGEGGRGGGGKVGMNTERSGRVEERRGCEGESTSMGWVVRQCHFLIFFSFFSFQSGWYNAGRLRRRWVVPG